MARSLIFGMVTATAMTLLIVPLGYLILEDVKRLFGRLLGRRQLATVPA